MLKTTQEMQLSRTSCMNHARSRSYHPCRDPLHDADMFKEQYERCAVLKDLQNSHDWKEQFMACQRQLVRARRWMLGKARRAHAATSRASTPGGKAKAKAKSTASRAGATARASTPGAPSPAASTGATASASSSGARPASSSTRTPTSASTPEPVLFKFDTCLKTLVKKRESPNQAESLNWLTAVAHGGSVEVEGKRTKMTPGIRKAQRLDISPSFVFRYPQIYESL